MRARKPARGGGEAEASENIPIAPQRTREDDHKRGCKESKEAPLPTREESLRDYKKGDSMRKLCRNFSHRGPRRTLGPPSASSTRPWRCSVDFRRSRVGDISFNENLKLLQMKSFQIVH